MKKMKVDTIFWGIYFVVSSVVYGASVPDNKVNHRAKRYNKPYPIPTIPMRPTVKPTETIPNFAALLESAVPANCPTSQRHRKMLPSDDQLMELLRAQGGTYNQHYMATDQPTARNFPNMLTIRQTYEDENVSAIVNFNPSLDNDITKAKLLEDLNKWSSLKEQMAINASLNRQNISEPPTTVDTFNSNVFSRELNLGSSPILEQGKSAILDSDFKASLEQINKNIDQILRGNSVSTTDLLDLARNMNISIHPRYLQPLEQGGSHGSRRQIRSADGSTSTVQYCRKRGSETSDGFLHMCSVCAVTTELEQDKFPRHINELVCESSDRTCFEVQNTPHGVCKQSVTYLLMLRRRPGGCMMLIESGQKVYVDAWEPYNQKIRTGCECFINSRSLFSKYIFGR